GMRGDRRDILELRPTRGDEHEIDLDQVFTDDAEPRESRQSILSRGDATPDGVLDRDHRRVASPFEHIRAPLADVVHRTAIVPPSLGHLIERCFGEGARWPQVAVSTAFSHAFHLSPVLPAPALSFRMRARPDRGTLEA